MKLTVFGKIMAGILLAAIITAMACAGTIIDGTPTEAHYIALVTSLAAGLLIAIVFNTERRR